MSEETIKTEAMLYRLGTLTVMDNRVDGEKGEMRQVELSFSSEEPYERWFGIEILDHDKKSVQMDFLKSGNAPLLLDHDPTQQIGVIEKASIDNERGRAQVRFGKNALANDIFNDVQDGIRKNISVGYRVNRMVLEEEHADKPDIYRVNDWSPLEVSVVSIPADQSVGIGRAHERNVETIIIKGNKMEQTIEVKNEVIEPKIDNDAIKNQIRKEELARVKDINTLAVNHNLRAEGEKAIIDGLSISEFRGVALEKIGEGKPLETVASQVGLNKKEKSEYSLIRAIKASASQNWNEAGFEKELSDEIRNKSGKEPRGFYVPHDLNWGQRDLTAGTTTAGGFLVETSNVDFVDALRAQLVVADLGARMMDGLVGDVTIPALNAKTAVAWVAENTAAAEGAPTFRQISLSPKTVSGFVDLSRKLLAQSSPSVEAVIRADLLAQIANEIDDVAIEGGDSDEPTGITQTAGLGSVSLGTNGAAPTWSSVISLISEVEIDNALNGSLAFVMSPAAKAKLMSTVRVSSTDSLFIMNENDMLAGYRAVSTSNSPSDLTKGSGSSLSALTFGNFNELIIASWGGLDISVDPYSLSTIGATRMTSFYDVDVAVRHAESFSAIVDMVTT